MENKDSVNQDKGQGWRIAWWVWLVLGGLVAFWFTGGYPLVRLPVPIVVRWLIAGVIMLLVLVLAGRNINGRVMGALIDERYRVSLSRLQIVAWTILVLSAFLTIAVPRALGSMRVLDEQAHAQCVATQQQSSAGAQETCVASALNITFPTELLLALGISAASFAGSALIKSSKQSREVTIEARQK